MKAMSFKEAMKKTVEKVKESVGDRTSCVQVEWQTADEVMMSERGQACADTAQKPLRMR